MLDGYTLWTTVALILLPQEAISVVARQNLANQRLDSLVIAFAVCSVGSAEAKLSSCGL